MASDEAGAKPGPQAGVDGKALSPEARRALNEAAARRVAQAGRSRSPKEIGGRDGPDPTRYGDWEKKGLISDF